MKPGKEELSDMAAERQALRQRILHLRDSLPPEIRQAGSRAITAHLWDLDEFVRARVVFIYVNFRSEVETAALIQQSLLKNKKVCVPLTDRRHHRLLPYVITDPDRDLAPGSYGIPEPAPQCLPLRKAGDIEAVIVPGSVFDLHGGRLGYGGGYYDRFLVAEAPTALRIGIAFEAQLVETVPLEPHDQPLDILVTEAGIRMRAPSAA